MRLTWSLLCQQMVFIGIAGLVFITPVKAQDSLLDKQIDYLVQQLREYPELVPQLIDGINEYIDQKNSGGNHLSDDLQEWLYNNDRFHPWIGNPEPELTLVVFTDYDCPYCKQLDPLLYRLVDEFPAIKVINILIPMRQQNISGTELTSSDFGLNVWFHEPHKYKEASELLFKKNGYHTARSMQQIADKTKTEAALKLQRSVRTSIAKNYEIFQGLGLTGTPAIVVGDSGVIPGFIEYKHLAEIVAEELAQ